MKPPRSLVLVTLALALGLTALGVRLAEPEHREEQGLDLRERSRPGESAAHAELSPQEALPIASKEPGGEEQSVKSPPAPERADAAPDAPAVDPSTHILVEGQVLECLTLGEALPRGPGARLPISLKIGRVSLPKLETTTDAEGRFRFVVEWPPKKEFVFTLRVPEGAPFRPIRHQTTLSSSRRTLREMTLLRVQHGRAHGSVVDEEGLPLAGLRLSWKLRPEGARHGSMENLSGSLTTDREGKWQIEEPLPSSPWLDEVGGYELLDERPPLTRGYGGWREGSLSLRQLGSLEVSVSSSAGQPLEGARVVARRAEQRGVLTRATTDDAGLARLEGLPTRAELGITVEREGASVEGSLHIGGRLVPTPSREGRAIRLEEGWSAPLEVTLSAGPTLIVHCKGLDQQRRQVAVLFQRQGQWLVRRAVAEPGERATVRLPADLDSPGVWIRASARDESSATHPRDSGPSLSAGGATHVAQAEVSLRGDGEPTELTLELQPALTIAGAIVGAESSRATLRVRAEGPFANLEESAGDIRFTRRGSYRHEFEVSGLAPGNFTLEARSPKLGLGGATLVREGVPAGSSDLEFEMETVLGVEISIALPLDQVEHDALRVEVLRLAGTRASSPLRELRTSLLPPTDLEQREILGSWTGTLDSDESLQLPPATEGVYWLRLTPRGEGGKRFASVFSEPMLLRRGSHEFSYRVIPCGRVSVRFPREASEQLAAQLVDPSGLALPCFGQDGSTGTIHPRGSGRFLRLKNVPVGSYSLRVGSSAELAEGTARQELTVEVLEDDTTSLHLDQ